MPAVAAEPARNGAGWIADGRSIERRFDQFGGCRFRLHRRARHHGAHARRRAACHRHLSTGARRDRRAGAVSGDSRAHALWQGASASRSEVDRGESEPRPRPEVAAWFVRCGYVVIYQDCRGRYGSEGEFVKYLSDGEDGYDTIEWIAQQPWCDGRVATIGLSYAAHTQVSAACLAPQGARGDGGRLRWILECLSIRHPQRRRLRDEAGDLGLQPGLRESAGEIRSGGARGARRRRTSSTGSRPCRGSPATRRCAMCPSTRITCSSSGPTASSTTTGAASGSIPRDGTSGSPTCRRFTCRAGTTPTCPRRSRTIWGCASTSAGRCASSWGPGRTGTAASPGRAMSISARRRRSTAISPRIGASSGCAGSIIGSKARRTASIGSRRCGCS